ncbi:DUF3857 domain-containing protein [Thermoflexibacter ruber]|uniref:Transglutaminase-like enzyme, putative cysteine protease n=1 Tax=Thermoflexibacter ruber TaxID=1003 RepID=A0A1I2BM86_9BACT|nr:transglutaminase domain-containing protein [Thermoflexibacter ruber]SFE56918.1 Transglutaminase-like enzyme, putative cysteine protease [Thermoflexibacter ruber]
MNRTPLLIWLFSESIKGKQTMLFFLIVVCLWAITHPISGQPKPINSPNVSHHAYLNQMQKTYPNAKAIFTLKRKTINIGFEKNDSISIVAENRFEMLHLKNKSEQYATESVPFSKFNQILNINAYTQVYENSKLKRIKVQEKDYVTSSIVSKNWFYDDYKEKTFLFPAVAPGALTVLNYKEVIKEPRFLGVFYLNSYVPVEKSEYVLVVHKDIKIAYKLYGTQGVNVNFTKKKVGEQIIYTWRADKLAEYKIEKDAPSLSYYEPHIIAYITEIKKKPLLANANSLYQWYYSLTKDVNKEVLAEMQVLVDTLVKDKPTDREKAKTIFQWVQNHIKYIAIEDGLSGFIPKSASEVFKNRHGDCKDMSSIIVTMLKMANIPAYLTWIGTRKLPYTYYDVPTPMVDNHMIATAKIDGENIFLDATDSYLPFNMPTAMIQGKEAMIGIDSLHYEIATVPVVKSEENVLIDTSYVDIVGENIKAKGKMLLTGYYKSNAGLDILEKKKEEQKNNLVRLLGCDYLHPEVGQITYYLAEENDQQIDIAYDFLVEKHTKIAGKEIFLNLHLDRKWQYEMIDIGKRKTDREIEYKFNDVRCYVVNVPKDCKIEFIPPNSSFQNEKFGFSIEYAVKENQLIMTKKMYCNVLFITSKDFHLWNEMIKSLDIAYRNSVKIVNH